MKQALAVVLLTISTAPAFAGAELDWLCEDRYSPPVEYLWKLPFEPVVFYEMTPKVVIQTCAADVEHLERLLAKPYSIGGCAVYEDGFGWTINYRNDLTAEQRACVIRHELGHTVPNEAGEYWRHEATPSLEPELSLR